MRKIILTALVVLLLLTTTGSAHAHRSNCPVKWRKTIKDTVYIMWEWGIDVPFEDFMPEPCARRAYKLNKAIKRYTNALGHMLDMIDTWDIHPAKYPQDGLSKFEDGSFIYNDLSGCIPWMPCAQ